MADSDGRPTVGIKPTEVWVRMARLGFSQNGLARAIDRSPGHLSLVLNGRRNASPEMRANMLRELDANFDDLFYLEYPDE